MTSVSLDVKVVVDAMDILPPTRYVPAGSVGEVSMVVAPFPTVTVVTVFTRVGGASAFTPVGTTMYAVVGAALICRERRFLFAVITNAA